MNLFHSWLWNYLYLRLKFSPQLGGFVSIIPPKRLENPLKTVGNHDYPKVNFSHPSGLTVRGGKEFLFQSDQMFLLKHVWRVIPNPNPTQNQLMNFSNPILILILPLQEIDGFI